MKKVGKIVGIVFFTTLYGFFIFLASGIQPVFSSASQAAKEKKNKEATVSISHFYPAGESESAENTFNFSVLPNFKIAFPNFWAITKTSEQFMANKFRQYAAVLKYFPIQFNKTDIIFPFQYFW